MAVERPMDKVELMNKAQSMMFFAALQRVMLRHRVHSIEERAGRIVFFGIDGKPMCSFESLDRSSDDLSDCVLDAGYREF